jgi:putative DNA primase/helicase
MVVADFVVAGAQDMNTDLQAALSYAKNSWHVHPSKPDKTPLTKWGSTATTHAPTIRNWWRRWPNALIGIACAKSGM